MTQQQLSYAEIHRLENDIQTTTESMTSQLHKLADMLAQLQADWKGLGADAFTKAQRDLNDDHNALRKSLEVINQAVHDTKVGSHSNDQQVLDDFKHVDVSGDLRSGIAGY
ncbi:WXG100 family type VII secretion target [Streptantibioticus ferralitis]|uniref:WXG100 family type VII secretion target n=1 Tax=Streptantibioticus ferralitis TaxID=236510 RepID=A0ABT5ZA79_9ACTN|nr:WXG100 family type VII secretion target [Streptantibioticus ferralitis]MDF2260751.1 WXG100 family type VII secretion target [Streptantibioticus ferralitis]